MSHGFIRSRLLDGLVRDPNTTSPACFETNLTATSRIGTNLTANASANTKATTYTTLIASSAAAAYGIWLTGFDVNTATTDTGILLDIATGAAAAEVDLIQNINMGEAPQTSLSTLGLSGKTFYFPGLNIPASTRISARIQAAIGSDTLSLAIWLDNRIQWDLAQSSWVTYGADTTNSRGTSVTAGNGTFGSWTAIGSTTSRSHKQFSIGFDSLGDTTLSANMVLVELGYGSPQTSIGIVQTSQGSNESCGGTYPPVLAFAVPSGSQLYARIASDAAENRGIIVYGN